MTIRHVDVYRDPAVYAGWPANHGAWQRGDELLVGFMRGPYAPDRSTHKIGMPRQKMLARSLDGGETWSIEIPSVDFDAEVTAENPQPIDLTRDILRCCGTYDHGGETCDPQGGYYVSGDFGRTWRGAFAFTGMNVVEPTMGTMRTAVLPERRLIFLSYADEWFGDFTICARLTDRSDFVRLSVVCNEGGRAVMPAVAEVGGRIVVALRRRSIRRCWIDVFWSDDGGITWHWLSDVADTGDYNGNPPALVAVDGRLFCAYANRSTHSLLLRESTTRGETWEPERTIRSGSEVDIGYPRLWLRADGRIVCAYYWSDAGEPQRIAASVIDV